MKSVMAKLDVLSTMVKSQEDKLNLEKLLKAAGLMKQNENLP